MNSMKDKLVINLALFDGGAAGAAAAAPAGDNGTTTGVQNATRSDGSDAGNQPSGVQDAQRSDSPDAGDKQTENPAKPLTAKERQAAYDKFIKDNSDIHSAAVQKIIDGRLHEFKTLQERMSASQPILDALMQRYGITDGDFGKLTEAVDKDHALWEDAADRAGMSVDAFRDFRRMQHERDSYRNAELQRDRDRAAEQQCSTWLADSEGMSADYPGFDLRVECENSEFVSMLRAGIPVRHAYEVAHLNDIKTNVATSAAQEAEKKVADNIRAQGARPAENGVSAQNGVTQTTDLSKLTAKDRAELARRSARERITFTN